LVADLSLPVEVHGCPTVREPDGLALSSRNVRLSAGERAAAVVLSRALDVGVTAVAGGERSPGAVADAMAAVIGTEPSSPSTTRAPSMPHLRCARQVG